MPLDIDREGWSGDGDLTQLLIDWLSEQPAVDFLRVEDAPSSRTETGYNFISNEIFLKFATRARSERTRLWGVLPLRRMVADKLMTITELDAALTADPELPAPDYADESMIQFLHTERIIPPYQTRGYKLIELVRLYEVGTPRREP